MNRRGYLVTVGASGTALTGCTAFGQSNPTPSAEESSDPDTTTDGTDAKSCDEYVYRSTTSEGGGQYPWHLHIRNNTLSTYPVAISITDLSGETAEDVVSCTATSQAHRELEFALSLDTRYRVHVTLDRPDNPEEAAMTVSGWNRVTGANEALRVAVENGEFVIRRVHTDPGRTPAESLK